MNVTDNVTNPSKGRPTSIPLLICVGLLGLGAAFAGPTVMTYYFLFQEEAKAQAIYKSASRPSLPSPGGVVASSDTMAGGGPQVGKDRGVIQRRCLSKATKMGTASSKGQR